jgi:NADH-quinone oxidoreductase subunit J
MSGAELAFWADAIVAIVTASVVILHRNPVVSALSLVLHLCSVAVFFLLLQASFLFAVQVIVYAGAIMVLFLFVVMLLDPAGEGVAGRIGKAQLGFTLAGAVLLLLGLGRALPLLAAERPGTVPAGFGEIHAMGRMLFTDYLFPFEVASVLLLVAMIGAMFMGRREAE